MITIQTLLTFIVGFSTAHFLFQHRYSQLNITENDGHVPDLQGFMIHAGRSKCKERTRKNHTVRTQHEQKSSKKEEKKSIPLSESSVVSTINSDVEKLKSLFPQDHPCSHFGASIPSAATYWNKHLGSIFNASRFLPEKKGENVFHDFTALLLHLMTTERLESSIKAVPKRSWDRFGELMELAYRRFVWIKDGSPEIEREPRKISILVLGGSVTMGIRCNMNPVQNDTKIRPRTCSWARRVSEFLSYFTSSGRQNFVSPTSQIFDVHAVAVGGTNTDSATIIWDYSLIPQDYYWPDFIIHAYSTNDMHVLSEVQAASMNITLDEMIMRVNEKFVRSVLSRTPRPPSGVGGIPCKPKTPLLLYFDDYIGNEQKGILKTMAFSKAVAALSSYYGFGVMSYADAVRDMVYTNTNETWFTPSFWPERNVHPGLGMHIASTWVVAFNLLNMATTYCSLPSTLAKSIRDIKTAEDDSPFGYVAVNGLPQLIGDTSAEQGPVPRLLQLPPSLGDDPTLDNLNTRWKESEAAAALLPPDDLQACDNNVPLEFNKPCIYAWIAHLYKNPKKIKQINNVMDPILKTNEGWAAVSDHLKVGYASLVPNSTFVMEFTNIEKPVKVITFMTMTSYGEMWEGSEAQVDIYIIKEGLETDGETEIYESMNILGYHDRNTSEIFPHTAELDTNGGKGGEVGDTLRIKVQHLSGKKFKIMGMAFCNR